MLRRAVCLLAHFNLMSPSIGIDPCGIDERLRLGGSLAYETTHTWQAAA
jgi:hypothetical protein